LRRTRASDAVGPLDHRAHAHAPDRRIFWADRLEWLALADEGPRYRDFMTTRE